MSTRTVGEKAREAAPGAVDAIEVECIAAATELQTVLEEEAQLLKRFAGAELVRLLSRKEFSVRELSGRLADLKRAKGDGCKAGAPLRKMLAKIDRLNRANDIFIQGSLAHWRELLSLLRPAAYGPGAEKGLKPPPKGLSFRREA